MLVGVVFVAIAFLHASTGSESHASDTTDLPPVEAPDLAAGTTAPLGSAALGEGFAGEVGGRTPLRGFGEVAVTVTSGDGRVCELCLMAAIDEDQRARGLMEVTDEDLGGYDGMLFEYPDEVDGSFWMRNTPMPLSIAYFDDQGRLVSTSDMEPCADTPDCPGYPAAQPFQYAIEVPEGQLVDIGAIGKATLHIDRRRCPLADGGS